MGVNTTISLTTVENVELALGLDCNVYTLQIEHAINRYSALLESVTGRKLKARTYTDYRIDGNGCSTLFFPEYPINSTTSLLIYDITDTLYHTVDTTDRSEYVTHGQIGKMWLPKDIFLSGEQNIVFTGNVGITDTSELAMLEEGVIDLIGTNPPNTSWRNSRIKSERLGSYSVTWDTNQNFSGATQNIINFFSRV